MRELAERFELLGAEFVLELFSTSRTMRRIVNATSRPRAVRRTRLDVGPPGRLAEIAELLELSQQVIHRLFGHLRLGSDLRRPLVFRPGVAQNMEMGRDDVRETGLVQPVDHPRANRVDRHAHQRADQRWSERGVARDGQVT